MRKAIAILCLALITANPTLACCSESFENSGTLEKGALLFFTATTLVGVAGMFYSIYAGDVQECPSNETSWCCDGWTPCIQINARNDSCGLNYVLYCGPDGDRIAPVVKKPWFEPSMISFGMVTTVGLIFSASLTTWIYFGHRDSVLRPMSLPLINTVADHAS